MVCPLKWAW